MAFAGKVVVVTGAASGIGRATALAFAQQGAQVTVCDLNVQGLTNVAARLTQRGTAPQVVELDVTNGAVRATH